MVAATSSGRPTRPSIAPVPMTSGSMPATCQALDARSDAIPPTPMQLARIPWDPTRLR